MRANLLLLACLLLALVLTTCVVPVQGKDVSSSSKNVKKKSADKTPSSDNIDEMIKEKTKKSGKKKKKKKKADKQEPTPAEPTSIETSIPASIEKDVEQAPPVVETPVPETPKEPEKPSKAASNNKFAERKRKYLVRTKKQEEARAKRVKGRLERANKANTKKASDRKTKKKAKVASDQKALKTRDENNERKRLADTPENRQRGLKKIQFLQKEASKASNNIISFDAEAFKEYAVAGSRPYWLFLVFTALTPQHQCTTCRWGHQAMVPLAESHGAYRKKNNNTLTYTDDPLQMPIFFVEVDVIRNREVFDKLAINSAPIVILVPPKLPEKSDTKLNQFLNKLPMKYRFTALTPTLTGDELNVWIGKVTGIVIPMQEGSISYELVVLMLVALALLGFFALKFHSFILLLIRSNRYVMMFGLWMAYTFCISGGMYNYIRQTQWAGYGKDGEIFNIAQDSHDQYVMESIIVGVVVCLCALPATLLARATFDFSDNAPKSMSKKVASSVMGIVLSPIVCFALLCMGWYQLLKVYSTKTYGYNMGMLQ